MPNQLATGAAARATTPQVLLQPNQQGGELTVLFSTVTNPPTGGVAVGEFISWGFLPIGARVLFGWLTCAAGAASSTLNLGDPVTPARYLAASSVASAANIAILPAASYANGAAGFVVDATTQEIRSVCAGAALGANQTLTLALFYVNNA